VFTARYALSPYRKQIRVVFKGLRDSTHTVQGNCILLSKELSFCIFFAIAPIDEVAAPGFNIRPYDFYSDRGIVPFLSPQSNWKTVR
jgi:hypothetical protein